MVTHPFVIGELACGNLKNRREVLDLMRHLPGAPVATDAETLAFIEQRILMGRDIGFIDVHLLASATLSAELALWTLDTRLAQVARDLGSNFGG